MTQEQFHDHVIASLARLETQITNLVGNGQPGRVQKLEDAVDGLKRDRWIVGGAITAFTAVSTLVAHFVFK